MKKLLALLLAAVCLLSFIGCTKKDPVPTEQPVTYKIGILQFGDFTALNEARDGFVAALKDNGYEEGVNTVIDVQNAQTDQTNLVTMSDHFVAEKVDLVLAIATPAAQAVAAKTTEIPILITAVTDPVTARLVESNEKPGTNVTGTNDMNPIKEQIDLLCELAPDAQKVGILYTSSEDNSVQQAGIAKECLEKLGKEVVIKTITGTNDVQQAAQALVEEVDAIYVPTDNNVAAAIALLGQVAAEAKVPVICGEAGMVADGGLATLGIDYYKLGYQTGLMAVRVLKGENPADIAIESQSEFAYAFNKEMIEAIGLTLPEKYEQYIK